MSIKHTNIECRVPRFAVYNQVHGIIFNHNNISCFQLKWCCYSLEDERHQIIGKMWRHCENTFKKNALVNSNQIRSTLKSYHKHLLKINPLQPIPVTALPFCGSSVSARSLSWKPIWRLRSHLWGVPVKVQERQWPNTGPKLVTRLTNTCGRSTGWLSRKGACESDTERVPRCC